MAEDDPSGETFILTDEPAAERKSFKRNRRINVWKSFLRHKRLGLLTFIAVIAVAEPVLYFRSVRPVYRAEALLTVAPVMMKNVIEDREYHVPRYDELVNEQLALVVREEITLDALERLKDDRALWMRPDESRRDAANRLSSALIVRRVPDSTYISIALEGKTPQGLDTIVNTVIEAYMARVKGKGMYGQEVREETLQQRKAELQEEIRKKTDQLSAWAKELGVAGFEKPIDGSSVETKTLFDARTRLKDAEAKYEAMKVRNEVLRKADLTGEARDLVATDPEVVSMKTVLLPKKNEFRAKAMGLTAEHEGRKEIERLMSEIDSDLAKSEKSALERIRTALGQRRDMKLNNELELALSEVEQAQRYEKTLAEEIRNQTGKTARFNSIYYEALSVRQEVERLNRQLAALEDRLDAMRLEAQRPGFVTLVAPARAPEKPVSRPMGTLIVLFAFLGVGLALAVPTIVDTVDHRIQSPIDVEAVIDSRPLGWVLERSPRSTNFADDQIRRIALSLERHRRVHQRGQIAFMSLRPGGGTTQLVLDLARELRAIGSRVVVVEANALHPDGRYLAPRGHPGLVGALAGQIRLEETILPPRDLLTYRIPIGNTEGAPMLANSRNLRAVLNGLSGTYDMVLIDAPPLFVSSDAELISSCAQGVILVVEAGKVVTGEVKRAVDIAREIGPLMIEVVVNRVRDYRGHGYYSDLVEQYESAGRVRSS
jgi:polysaccharide biosynthesis transport protein